MSDKTGTVTISKFSASQSLLLSDDSDRPLLLVYCLPSQRWLSVFRSALAQTVGFGFWYRTEGLMRGQLPFLLSKARGVVNTEMVLCIDDVVNALNEIATKLEPLSNLSLLSNLSCLCNDFPLPPPPIDPPSDGWDNPPPIPSPEPIVVGGEFCQRLTWGMESLKWLYQNTLNEFLNIEDWQDWQDVLEELLYLLPPTFSQTIELSWVAFLALAEELFTIAISSLIAAMNSTFTLKRDSIICTLKQNSLLSPEEAYNFVLEQLQADAGAIEYVAWLAFVQMIDFNSVFTGELPAGFNCPCAIQTVWLELFGDFAVFEAVNFGAGGGSVVEGEVNLPFQAAYYCSHTLGGEPVANLRIWTSNTKETAYPVSVVVGEGSTNADMVRVWVEQVPQAEESLVLPYTNSLVTEIRLRRVVSGQMNAGIGLG